MRIHLNEQPIESAELTQFPDFDITLSLPHSNMNIFMNPDEADQFSLAVSDGVSLMLDSSNYAPVRLTLLLKGLQTWYHHVRNFNLLENGNVDDAHFLNFIWPLRAWNKDLREFMGDLSKTHPNDFPEFDYGEWTAASMCFPRLTEDQRKTLTSTRPAKMTNASSLAGLVKPDYFNTGTLHFSVGESAFQFKAKREEADTIFNHCLDEKSASDLDCAKEAWEQLDLLQTAFGLLVNLMKQNGLDDDLDFIYDNCDQEQFISLYFEFESVLLSPEQCKAFIKKYQASRKKEDSKISITVS